MRTSTVSKIISTLLNTYTVFALPTNLPLGPEPGQSSYYSTYDGKADAFPANTTSNITLPTANGQASPNDLLFQNLLSAEWAIYSFYQQGVERFNASAFEAAGFPNTTYGSIIEIRDNEAGHLRIFQEQISSASVIPGRCEYNFGFTDVTSYLELQTLLEVSSMAFLTGLILQARADLSKSALVAIAETESRHNAWALIEIWNTSPFAGPADTVYPYANQILDSTNLFIIPGSCPKENPPYPSPNQGLPTLSYIHNTTTGEPGSNITFTFPDARNQPNFEEGKEYFVVANHGIYNHTVPYDVGTATVKIPTDIEGHRGVILMVIADEVGAPTLESVIAGPLIVLNQPTPSSK